LVFHKLCSKANTEILAKNLEEMERKEQSRQERQESNYMPESSLTTEQTISELLQQVSQLAIQPHSRANHLRAAAAGQSAG
jgi:hypothetical protein